MIRTIQYLHQQGKRANVEDNIFPEGGKATLADRIFLVCDGVGGEAKGEIASKIVCETFGAALQARKLHTEESIQEGAQQAVAALRNYAEAHPAAQRMSTTVTLACLDEEGIWVGWCGDSRIYHIRNGQVLWRSKDHSFVQMLVNIGQITEEEAQHHEKRNLILKSFSAQQETAALELHRITDVKSGDYLLLCTDGLLEQITDGLLYQLLQDGSSEKDLAEAFNAFCFGKTADNYSMYLINLTGSSTIPSRVKKGSRSFSLGLLALIIMLVAAGIYVFLHRSTPQSEHTPASVSGTTQSSPHTTQDEQVSTPLPSLPVKPGSNNASVSVKKDSLGAVKKKPDEKKKALPVILPDEQERTDSVPVGGE